MWNEPTQQELSKVPGLYETEHIPLEEKLVHFHFFIGSCDWFVVEFDGEDTFFGFAVLGGDIINAEWGFIPFSELKSINVRGFEIDRDLHWKVKPAKEVPLIKQKLDMWEKAAARRSHGIHT